MLDVLLALRDTYSACFSAQALLPRPGPVVDAQLSSLTYYFTTHVTPSSLFLTPLTEAQHEAICCRHPCVYMLAIASAQCCVPERTPYVSSSARLFVH